MKKQRAPEQEKILIIEAGKYIGKGRDTGSFVFRYRPPFGDVRREKFQSLEDAAEHADEARSNGYRVGLGRLDILDREYLKARVGRTFNYNPRR